MMTSLIPGIGPLAQGHNPLPSLMLFTSESTEAILSGTFEGLLSGVFVMLVGIVLLFLVFNHGIPAVSEVAEGLTHSFQNWRIGPHSPLLQQILRALSSIAAVGWIIIRTPVWVALRALGLMAACFMLLVWSLVDLLVSVDRKVPRKGDRPLMREW